MRLPSQQSSFLILGGMLLGLGAGALMRSPAAPVAHADAPPTPSPSPGRDAARRALSYSVTIEEAGVYGAGILVFPGQGLVLTAAHVVEGMTRPAVSLASGQRLAARVLEVDRALDLALLGVPPQPGTPPLLGDPLSLDPGDGLLAVGCPRHLPFSVARGVVSYVGRPMDGLRWLQTDIPVNEGNSGGPVVDHAGRLVGMTSFILRRSSGLAFALPIDYALERFAQLAALADAGRVQQFRQWRGPLPGARP